MNKTIKILIAILILIIVIICILLFIFSTNNINFNNTTNVTNTTTSEYKDYEEQPIQKKEKYECNEFSMVSVTTENLLNLYFNHFKDTSYQNIEEAYNLLEEEYRKKRFGSIDAFNEYIQNNENFSESYLTRYDVNTFDEYTQYVCIDQNGKYYIFNETSVMDYDIILDTYTIDLPQFLEQYNEASAEQKAYMNVQKVYEAINNKDYNYVYNKLDNSFKQNNFATIEEFEQYVQESFLENTEIEGSVKVSDSGQYYVCTVQTVNNDTGDQKEETIIIKLNEGTDFVMSFTVEE